jgi:hypothetical protein
MMGVSPVVVHTADALLENPSPVLQETREDEVARIGRLPPAERVRAEVLRYRPSELHLSIDAPAPGWLLVTDRWGPGWRAVVNGRPIQVLGGNFIFRAVEVERGRNVVRFSYRSAAFPGFLLLSWSVIAGLVVAAAISGFRRKRDNGRR